MPTPFVRPDPDVDLARRLAPFLMRTSSNALTALLAINGLLTVLTLVGTVLSVTSGVYVPAALSGWAAFAVPALTLFMHLTYRLDPTRYVRGRAHVAASYACLLLLVVVVLGLEASTAQAAPRTPAGGVRTASPD